MKLFTSFLTKKTFKIDLKSNCKSINTLFIYLYQQRYVGKSEWLFYFRLNNYRHRIKSMDQYNLILDEQLFRSHKFNKVPKFTIKNKLKKWNEINNLKKRDKWIKSLRTYVPFGFDVKIKSPKLEKIFKKLTTIKTYANKWTRQ